MNDIALVFAVLEALLAVCLLVFAQPVVRLFGFRPWAVTLLVTMVLFAVTVVARQHDIALEVKR
ncbi:MAG: hypothetical protein EPO08_21370 [Rhodospirillaceae bacterium]|nr:MAG: hypothetical protein EPO08_21370 [Rhodospirillaceae bacterium]